MSELNAEDDERPYGGRGASYRWLRDNYGFVTNWITEKEPAWETIAERMGREGVVGARGARPTRRSVWKVWKRVCRDITADAAAREIARSVAEEEAAAHLHEMRTGIPARKRQPSDLPANWAPPTADRVQKSVVPAIATSPALGKVPLGPDGQRETSLERQYRKLAEDSGRGSLTLPKT